MRVIAGRARGCRLQPVEGMHTRPTTDRVKENIFNLIQDRVYGASVLDLFAGTGQLGIEALSRGAVHSDFVEQAKRAYTTLCKNIQAVRMQTLANVYHMSAAQFVASEACMRYEVIFLDPPYGGALLSDALRLIETFDILSKNGIIVCESAKEDCFSHGFSVVRARSYGATTITILQRKNGGMDEDRDENGNLSG